MSNQVALIEPR